jgi:hypothetical protein
MVEEAHVPNVTIALGVPGCIRYEASPVRALARHGGQKIDESVAENRRDPHAPCVAGPLRNWNPCANAHPLEHWR